MFKTFILILALSFSTLIAQEVRDISFPISGNATKTDSVQVPAGMIISGIWSSTLIAGTVIGFNLSVDDGATFLVVGEVGIDTTAYSIPLDKNAGLIIPLDVTTTYVMKGTYTSEDNTTWLQLTSTVAQTVATTVIWARFIPYTGFGRD